MMKNVILILASFLAFCPAFGAEIPAELERLNTQRARQIAAIDKTYISQLELLKIKFTKAGNLDAANQVAALLRRFAVEDILGSYAYTGQDDGTWIYVLKENGVVFLPRDPKFKSSYVYNGGKLLIKHSNGTVMDINIDNDGNFSGVFTKVPMRESLVGGAVTMKKDSK